MGVLVISFDSVGDRAFEAMADDGENYPGIARFRREAYYRGGVKTVFVSNTYPVHTTVSTGRPPRDHGIVSNLLPPGKNGERPWAQMARYIKCKTLWEAAREKGLSVAAVLWPVTCGAKIDWHLPEVHLEKGQNRIFRNLLYGSVFFQLRALLKYGGELKGTARPELTQPRLDNFVTSVTCDLLKRKKPDLTLVHLIAYDTIFHREGSGGRDMDVARKAMDANLGRLLESHGEGGTAVVFSDHSQLDVTHNVNLNALYGNIFEQNGGCAFAGGGGRGVDALREVVEKQEWFARYLTDAEMEESGYAGRSAFGMAARPGYTFTEDGNYGGNHGYPTDYENYDVFYAVRGGGFAPGQRRDRLKGRITDVTTIIAEELGLDLKTEAN